MNGSLPNLSLEEVLKGSVQERLNYFRNRVIGHRRLLEARDYLLSRARLKGNVQLIFFFGPTGAGKTTVVQRSSEELKRLHLEDAIQDPSLIPVVYVVALRAEAGSFSWIGFYGDILKALAEPHIDRRIIYPTKEDTNRSARNRGKSAREMRELVVDALRRHETSVLFIDEAQHMQSVASAKQFQAQLDILKTLADETGVLIVLIGPFELVRYLELNAQFARRSERYYFGRYLPNNPSDRQEFTDIIASLASFLPLPEPSNLLEHVQFVYEGSLGLVGAYKNWLDRTLFKALRRNDSQISLADLKANIMSAAARLKIAQEINEFENAESSDEVSQAQIRELLGLAKTPNASKAAPHKNGDAKVRRSVGERAPARDPVGENGIERAA